ncbi:M20/M25/M40 family metallo-hydrolase [bacterium]|nr:M20/M25/M40 family metallo-hydrolase [bacterium]
MNQKKLRLNSSMRWAGIVRFNMVFLALAGSLCATAQPLKREAREDSIFLHTVHTEALVRGHSYQDLRSLCKTVGHRLSGSPQAAMAVRWGQIVLAGYGFDTVYLQPVAVPHWERGTPEVCWMNTGNGAVEKLSVLALGGSPPTDGLLEADVVYLASLKALDNLPEGGLKGKIAFFDEAFDPAQRSTFRAYGACAAQRFEGSVRAAALGASGVVIRSLASGIDDHPHTGVMSTEGDLVPAAALSTLDANRLRDALQAGNVVLSLQLNCRTLIDAASFNVIAELWGDKGRASDVISFGGHLDSWDVGEGAHDDGAGVVHSIEALRLLKVLGYRPKHTLRCVLFMNEENGNFGGKTYARWVHERGERHVAALESDRGGFLPLGFDAVGTEAQVRWLQSMGPRFSGFGLHEFKKGYGGVDIGPLLEFYPEMLQLGLSINSQRYFDHHHAETDVFESVNQRELELGCAALASMVYLVDRRYAR